MPRGTLNVFKIKGIHQAIRSGALAAEHLAEAGKPAGYDARWRALRRSSRAARGSQLQAGLQARPVLRACSTPASSRCWRARRPGRCSNKADWSALEKLDEYTSPDRGWVDRSLPPRDRLASVFFAGNVHDEAQPVHLKVLDTSICVDRCTKEYGNPCENFCPAGVYEMVRRRPGRPAPADQRRELRALQGVRHQGPVRDHQLDDAGRRLRAELSESLKRNLHLAHGADLVALARTHRARQADALHALRARAPSRAGARLRRRSIAGRSSIPENFWSALWDFCEIRAQTRATQILEDGNRMPGARWFVDARLNYAENLLRRDDDTPAIIFRNERGAAPRALVARAARARSRALPTGCAPPACSRAIASPATCRIFPKP